MRVCSKTGRELWQPEKLSISKCIGLSCQNQHPTRSQNDKYLRSVADRVTATSGSHKLVGETSLLHSNFDFGFSMVGLQQHRRKTCRCPETRWPGNSCDGGHRYG